MKNYKGWEGFIPGKWSNDEVNVRDFIQRNYTVYEGDDSFLAPATDATKKLWEEVMALYAKERENGGVLDADTKIVSSLKAFFTCSAVTTPSLLTGKYVEKGMSRFHCPRKRGMISQ